MERNEYTHIYELYIIKHAFLGTKKKKTMTPKLHLIDKLY